MSAPAAVPYRPRQSRPVNVVPACGAKGYLYSNVYATVHSALDDDAIDDAMDDPATPRMSPALVNASDNKIAPGRNGSAAHGRRRVNSVLSSPKWQLSLPASPLHHALAQIQESLLGSMDRVAKFRSHMYRKRRELGIRRETLVTAEKEVRVILRESLTTEKVKLKKLLGLFSDVYQASDAYWDLQQEYEQLENEVYDNELELESLEGRFVKQSKRLSGSLNRDPPLQDREKAQESLDQHNGVSDGNAPPPEFELFYRPQDVNLTYSSINHTTRSKDVENWASDYARSSDDPNEDFSNWSHLTAGRSLVPWTIRSTRSNEIDLNLHATYTTSTTASLPTVDDTEVFDQEESEPTAASGLTTFMSTSTSQRVNDWFQENMRVSPFLGRYLRELITLEGGSWTNELCLGVMASSDEEARQSATDNPESDSESLKTLTRMIRKPRDRAQSAP